MADRDWRRRVAEVLASGDRAALVVLAWDMADELKVVEERRKKDADRKRNKAAKSVEISAEGSEASSADSVESGGLGAENGAISADSADSVESPPSLPSRSSPTPLSNSSFPPPASSSSAASDVENSVGTWETPAEERVARTLETDPDRQAFRSILEASPHRPAWGAEIAASLDGMHGPALTGRALGAVLRDYVGNGDHLRPSFKHFRAYLRRPDREEPEPPAEGGGPVGAGSSPQTPAGGQGEASLIVSRIMEFKGENRPPGQSPTVYLRKAEVEAMGEDIATAFAAVGGSARFLATSGKDHSFLVRDFRQALEAARAQGATSKKDGPPLLRLG